MVSGFWFNCIASSHFTPITRMQIYIVDWWVESPWWTWTLVNMRNIWKNQMSGNYFFFHVPCRIWKKCQKQNDYVNTAWILSAVLTIHQKKIKMSMPVVRLWARVRMVHYTAFLFIFWCGSRHSNFRWVLRFFYFNLLWHISSRQSALIGVKRHRQRKQHNSIIYFIIIHFPRRPNIFEENKTSYEFFFLRLVRTVSGKSKFINSAITLKIYGRIFTKNIELNNLLPVGRGFWNLQKWMLLLWNRRVLKTQDRTSFIYLFVCAESGTS